MLCLRDIANIKARAKKRKEQVTLFGHKYGSYLKDRHWESGKKPRSFIPSHFRITRRCLRGFKLIFFDYFVQKKSAQVVCDNSPGALDVKIPEI